MSSKRGDIVKERPILFNGEMVRAILDGRKTQTRRVLKEQPEGDLLGFLVGNCPFGEVGSKLWVRETFWHRKEDGISTYADGSMRTHPSAIIGSKYVDEQDVSNWPSIASSFGYKTVPSIHMPRWASRITLEITGMRVERLNDISAEDAKAEGLEDRDWMGPSEITLPCGKTVHGQSVECFKALWESINGPGSWALNPWVWVVEFRRIDQ